MSLRTRLDDKIAELDAELVRLEKVHAANVAAVNAKLATLRAATGVVTKEVEGAYDALIALKLISEI